MTKKLAKQIAELWNENFAGCTEETKTKAIVEEPATKMNYKTNWSVAIVPDGDLNDGNAFYHSEELTDVRRTFKVGGYVHIENGKCVGRLY